MNGELKMRARGAKAKRRARRRPKRNATAERAATNNVFDRIQQTLPETEEQKKKHKGVYPDETI